MIHPRHFCGFTAHQRATGLQAAFGDAVNDAGRGIDVQFTGRVIIQEKQRLSTLNHQVVHAHGDQVDADGVVTLQIHCQTQLGTDAVGAGDQYRLAVFLRQCAQRAESAQSPHHFRATGFLHHALNTVDESVACINIHAGIFIAERGFVGHCEVSTRLR